MLSAKAEAHNNGQGVHNPVSYDIPSVKVHVFLHLIRQEPENVSRGIRITRPILPTNLAASI